MTEAPPESAKSAATTGIFDEPALSRQWVLRRLQRALDMEEWGGALRSGIGHRAQPPFGTLVAAQAASATERAAWLRRWILTLGSAPYAHLGAAKPVGRGAGWLVAALSTAARDALVRRLAAHTLSEYKALAELAEGAPGVPAELGQEVRSLLHAATVEAAAVGLPVAGDTPGSEA